MKAFQWIITMMEKMANALPSKHAEESLAAAIALLAIDRFLLLGVKEIGAVHVVEDGLIEVLSAVDPAISRAASLLTSEMDRQVRLMKVADLR